jgi:hypothetical protein
MRDEYTTSAAMVTINAKEIARLTAECAEQGSGSHRAVAEAAQLQARLSSAEETVTALRATVEDLNAKSDPTAHFMLELESMIKSGEINDTEELQMIEDFERKDALHAESSAAKAEPAEVLLQHRCDDSQPSPWIYRWGQAHGITFLL